MRQERLEVMGLLVLPEMQEVMVQLGRRGRLVPGELPALRDLLVREGLTVPRVLRERLARRARRGRTLQ